MKAINEIANRIHDCWFDADVIRNTYPASDFVMPLFRCNPRSPKNENIYRCAVMSIRNVSKVLLLDTEKIGYYDINTLVWDDQNSKISVLSNIPLILEFFVTALDVDLVEEEPKDRFR